MAEEPSVKLTFPGGCPDCGDRQVDLPLPLPAVGDDFDWRVRDYDGFRLSMLEELAARYPERTRWTPADLEVVIVEVLAAVLDQLSDQLDRVTSEAYLETARRPESVRRHLALLGYDPVRLAVARRQIALAGLTGAAMGDAADVFTTGVREAMTITLNVDRLGAKKITLGSAASLGLIGNNAADGQRLAAAIKNAVVALAPGQTPYEDFTVTYGADRKFVLTSGSKSSLSSVVVYGGTGSGTDLAQLIKLDPASNPEPGETTSDLQVCRRLTDFWFENPSAMEEARLEGPRSIHQQHRMVTADDYGRRLEEHPLVLRARATVCWAGSWTTVEVALVLFGDEPVDAVVPASLAAGVARFHVERGIPLPAGAPSIRTVLTAYVDAYRMVGQEVVLIDAVRVPVTFALSVRVASNYFQSEVRRALGEVLGTGASGFFRPGRLRFGEDLRASDLIAAAMALAGVESVCLNRFRRLGNQFADQVASGRIVLAGIEVAICDNEAGRPNRGYYRLTLHGGLKG